MANPERPSDPDSPTSPEEEESWRPLFEQAVAYGRTLETMSPEELSGHLPGYREQLVAALTLRQQHMEQAQQRFLTELEQRHHLSLETVPLIDELRVMIRVAPELRAEVGAEWVPVLSGQQTVQDMPRVEPEQLETMIAREADDGTDETADTAES